MKKSQLLSVSFILFILLLTSCTPTLPIETDKIGKVTPFSFTTQDDESFSHDDLAGTWWIADFIFTNCRTACLPMTANMAKLQEHLIKAEISDVQLLSFSVDPDFDSPDVLKEYGEGYGADFSRWTFLTGYDFKTIKELSVKSFRAFLQEPEPGSDQFTHDTRLFLVDPEGNIVKGYSGLESESVDQIMDDILTLQETQLLN